MSSTYRILCLSHDPATAHGEYRDPAEAEAAIAAGVSGHPECDLVIGRYSYPLVALGCPPTRPVRPGAHTCSLHNTTKWIGTEWLRLLAAAHQSGDEAVRRRATDRLLCCWPWERLRRLRDELSTPQEAASA